MSTKNVLLRLEQLIALASSPNEHEARNAALLAVELIKRHKIELRMPPGRVATPAPRNTPRGTPKRKSSGSKRGVRTVADPPERIVAPLGGDCISCGGRYRSDQPIYWFASGGGMHVRCYEDWLKSK